MYCSQYYVLTGIMGFMLPFTVSCLNRNPGFYFLPGGSNLAFIQACMVSIFRYCNSKK